MSLQYHHNLDYQVYSLDIQLNTVAGCSEWIDFIVHIGYPRDKLPAIYQNGTKPKFRQQNNDVSKMQAICLLKLKDVSFVHL